MATDILERTQFAVLAMKNKHAVASYRGLDEITRSRYIVDMPDELPSSQKKYLVLKLEQLRAGVCPG